MMRSSVSIRTPSECGLRRLSGAAAAARFRGQHEREVAAPAQTDCRPAMTKDETSKYTIDCGKFLALCDNTVRLCPSRNAIPRVEIAHRGRSLRGISLYPRDRRVERCARCAVAAQGENAEPRRVHSVSAQSEVASGPDLGLLIARLRQLSLSRTCPSD